LVSDMAHTAHHRNARNTNYDTSSSSSAAAAAAAALTVFSMAPTHGISVA